MKKEIPFAKNRHALSVNALALVVVLCCFTKAFSQNLIQNGSFELTPFATPPTTLNANGNAGFSTKNPGDNTLTNWIISSSAIEQHHALHFNMGCPPGAGSYHVDLNSAGRITQTGIALTAGNTYQLRFWSSVHANNLSIVASASVSIGSTGMGVLQTANISKVPADRLNWIATVLPSFVAPASGSVDISFQGTGSTYNPGGGVLIDSVSLIDVTPAPPLCEDLCFWRLDGNSMGSPIRNKFGTLTNHAVKFITNGIDRGIMMHSGIFGLGTTSPVGDSRLTVDNRNNNQLNNSAMNAITAFAMHDDCTSGYGVNIITNAMGGTKALLVQGNGTDRAIIYGNGMSWFKNRMTIGSTPPSDICWDNTSGTLFTVEGSGFLQNGVFVSSDRRFKKNIQAVDNALDILNKLNAVVYEFDTEKFPSRNFTSGTTYGFIAQELKEVIPSIVNIESDGFYSVNYTIIIPILSQAIKDQQTQIEELKSLIQKQGVQTGSDKAAAVPATDGFLGQNTPNPFSNSTEINYQLPKATQSAVLGIYDLNGKQIRMYPINSADNKGSVKVNAGELQGGMYIYTLVVDGKIFDSKRMVIIE